MEVNFNARSLKKDYVVKKSEISVKNCKMVNNHSRFVKTVQHSIIWGFKMFTQSPKVNRGMEKSF